MESRAQDLNRLAWTSILVAAATFLFLAWPVERIGIAAAYSNPVDKIHAQDESIYAGASLHAAAHGNWLTPITMGRIYLGKPPLLYILTGLSLKALGTSLFALRLPCLLAGSITVALLFRWGSSLHGYWTGLIAALLLLSNPVWDIFARLCYTDMLLVSFSAAAMYFLSLDQALENSKARWGFVLCCAAAILSKSLAGILPILSFLIVSISFRRIPVARCLQVLLAIALLAAPWHIYQFIMHPQWFWTDYFKIQLFQFGVKPLIAGTPENTLWFYGKRLFLTDPVLCILVILALPVFAKRLKSRNQDAWLLACWIGVIAGAILAFRWRSFPYALMLLAPASLIVATSIPKKLQPWTSGAAALLLFWTGTLPTDQPLPAAPALQKYLAMGRSNELILVDTDDEFYSATLPLRKTRYIFRDPAGATQRLMPHYVDLGITVTAAQFNNLSAWEPKFQKNLHDWHFDSTAPIATTIVAQSDAEVSAIVLAHPESDFYLPASLAPSSDAAHIVEQATPDRILLLSQHVARQRAALAAALVVFLRIAVL